MKKIHFEKINPVKAITDEDFAKLSNLIGRNLPNDYMAFYRLSNGGRTEENTIYDENGNYIFSISQFYPLISNIDEFNDVDNVFVRMERHILEDELYVPLGRDGAGNELYIDFNEEIPTVCACLFDEPDEEEGTLYTHIEISETISEFINSLQLFKDDE